MSNEYPLYPELPEGGAEEAQELIEKFKKQLAKVVEDVIGDMYVDIVPHIESDAWTNYRNDLLAGLTNYRNRKIQGDYDFTRIRRSMYEEYRDEIIEDLNQDLLKENESLKKQIEMMQKSRECLL
jgi:hypothetical protein